MKIRPLFSCLVSLLLIYSLLGMPFQSRGSSPENASSVQRRPDDERSLFEPEDPNMEEVTLIGQIGGTAQTVANWGNHAYLGVGPRLVIVNITNPANPTIVGRSEVLPSRVQDIDLSGNFAYVAAGKSGLRIFSIANPDAPVEVGEYIPPDLSPEFPQTTEGVTVLGNYAYLATGDASLEIINITNPSAPVHAGHCSTYGYSSQVVVVQSALKLYAYVADGNSGLGICDVTTPVGATEIGSIVTPDAASDVVVSGNYAYVTAKSSGLRVIDISNPTAPVEKGNGVTPGSAWSVELIGAIAYVADEKGGLRIFDISNPASPSASGFFDTNGEAYDVDIAGDNAFIADGYNGLRVINVANPNRPSEIGHLDTPIAALDAIISGSYAYVASGKNGLRIIDIADPSTPIEASFSPTPGYANDVAIAGSYAYVADGLYGLRVIDISDPNSPVTKGSYITPGNAMGVAVSDHYAFVVDLKIKDSNPPIPAGLSIVDITNPNAPTKKGYTETTGDAYDVAIAGGYAYVAEGPYGLGVIDISDPSVPKEKSLFNTPGTSVGVAVSGNYAYVADNKLFDPISYSLQILDISDPLIPSYKGSFVTTDEALDVSVSGVTAYVTAKSKGLFILDVTNPASPQELYSSYDTPGDAWSARPSGNYVYVADGEGGLVVLKKPVPPAPVYLPLLTNDFISYFEGPWEQEDNNTAAHANGPLRSGKDYYGFPDDANDYFFFSPKVPGSIQINLTGHTGGGVQVLLYYQDVSQGPVIVDNSDPYQITYAGQPGVYYLRIYTAFGYNVEAHYTLQVTYP